MTSGAQKKYAANTLKLAFHELFMATRLLKTGEKIFSEKHKRVT